MDLLALLLFSGSEGPVTQADRPNTFVLSLPRCLKIPGRQDNHSLPLVALKVPGRRPSRCCWWRCHSAGEPDSARSTGQKIQQLQAPSGNLDQNCNTLPSLVTRDTSVIIGFLWGLSEWLMFFYMVFECYIDKANHMLRFDLICRRSSWLEILT